MVQSCWFTIDAGMQTVLNVAQEKHLLYHLRNTTRRDAVDSQMLDVGLHERRRARRMQDPDFRESYDRASREITQTDAVIRALDSLRAELGISKAELARRVNRNASSVRRLFTADRARPELPLIIAIADALDAEVCIVPRQAEARSTARSPGRRRRVPTAIWAQPTTVGFMTPRNRKQKGTACRSGSSRAGQAPWVIIYFKASQGTVPALAFLDECPLTLEAQFTAVLDAVAAAPPPQFSGGGKWEAMHGDMGGYYEIRLTGPGREQFRLFCLLENGTDEELARRGLRGPAIAVITGCASPGGWHSLISTTDTCGNLGVSTVRIIHVPSQHNNRYWAFTREKIVLQERRRSAALGALPRTTPVAERGDGPVSAVVEEGPGSDHGCTGSWWFLRSAR
jgi:ribosome-binding protein aMBF1 (putative translation factor)